MADYHRGKGLSWVNCCECEREFLVSTAVASGHPDDPPSILCERCADEYGQAEMEENRRLAYYHARIAE